MGLFKRSPQEKPESLSLEELQKSRPTEWMARYDQGQMRVAVSGFNWMTSKSLFGNKVCLWFETLLRQTMSRTDDFDRQNAFLNEQYASLLQGVRDILVYNWPEAWNDPASVKPLVLEIPRGVKAVVVARGAVPWKTVDQNLVLGPERDLKRPYDWELYGIRWIRGTLEFLENMARLQNELASSSGKSAAAGLWDPSVFKHEEYTATVSWGILHAGKIMSLIQYPGGPKALEKEIQRFALSPTDTESLP